MAPCLWIKAAQHLQTIHSPNTTQIATFLPAQLNELPSLSLSSPPHSYTIIYIVLCARAIKKSNVIIVVGFFIFLPFSDLPSSSFFLKMYSVHDMITSVSKSLADRASVGARTTTSRRETESGITFAFHVIYLPHPSQVRKSSYMYSGEMSIYITLNISIFWKKNLLIKENWRAPSGVISQCTGAQACWWSLWHCCRRQGIPCSRSFWTHRHFSGRLCVAVRREC